MSLHYLYINGNIAHHKFQIVVGLSYPVTTEASCTTMTSSLLSHLIFVLRSEYKKKDYILLRFCVILRFSKILDSLKHVTLHDCDIEKTGIIFVHTSPQNVSYNISDSAICDVFDSSWACRFWWNSCTVPIKGITPCVVLGEIRELSQYNGNADVRLCVSCANFGSCIVTSLNKCVPFESSTVIAEIKVVLEVRRSWRISQSETFPGEGIRSVHVHEQYGLSCAEECNAVPSRLVGSCVAQLAASPCESSL